MTMYGHPMYGFAPPEMMLPPGPLQQSLVNETDNQDFEGNQCGAIAAGESRVRQSRRPRSRSRRRRSRSDSRSDRNTRDKRRHKRSRKDCDRRRRSACKSQSESASVMKKVHQILAGAARRACDSNQSSLECASHK